MLEIINGESDISIRVLDWFVSNFSKKYNTFYKIKKNGRDEYFYVHNEYKNQLNGYSKKYFDPFCRKRKVIYTYKGLNGGNDIIFLSSIGQLNFFQWAIRNKILIYVKSHVKEIEDDMKITNQNNKKEKLQQLKDNELCNQDELINETNEVDNEPDPVICSSDKINSIHISSPSNKSANKSTSDKRIKRQQLSKSVYDFGIKKSNIPIKLDFE